jgi:phosphate transport system ATP-binding protein
MADPIIPTTVMNSPKVGVTLGVRAAAGPSPIKMAVENLDFFYGDRQVLKGITLDVPEKRITALIGPSGCGKSTLLRVLNRLDDMYPNQRAIGQVRLDGENILGPDVRLYSVRRRVGMVFQEPVTFPMSIRDNIAFGVKLHEKLSLATLNQRVEDALVRAALWPEVKDRLRSSARALSIGQQQRLCIARALATRPEVLLLDEPTSALDPVAMGKVEELMMGLKQDYTMVLVTHNMQQAARCADRAAFMYLGEIIETGSVEEIFTAPSSQQTRDYIASRFG